MRYKIITVNPLRNFSSIFANYESLVNYLSIFNNSPRFGCNKILDYADRGRNELREITIVDCNNVERKELVPYDFKYKIIDEVGRNVYSDQLVIDVLSHTHVRTKTHCAWARRYATKNHFKYRYDPVPNVHKPSGGHYYRAFSHVRDLKLASDPDISDFIRPSRNIRNLPNPYDLEKTRCIQKNWKSQGKYKKQWEHNIYGRSNIDTIKGFDKRHLDNMEDCIMMDEDIA